MTEFLLPLSVDEWKKPPLPSEATPLASLLGFIECDILTYLETNGSTSVSCLIRELEWPVPMVLMGLGSLVRFGLIRMCAHDSEVIVEKLSASRARLVRKK
jgi:hypothetical protein